MPSPTRLDVVTGLVFPKKDWPVVEGSPIRLPASDSVNDFISSTLRLVNLNPDIATGGELSYLVGPDALALNLERVISGRKETVRLVVEGRALIPKSNRYTGLAKGFSISKAAGISVGVSSQHDDLTSYELIANFGVKRSKDLSNHKLSQILVKGTPQKIAKNFDLKSLYISDQNIYEAYAGELAQNQVVTFSPIMLDRPPLSSREDVLGSSQISQNYFSDANWMGSF